MTMDCFEDFHVVYYVLTGHKPVHLKNLTLLLLNYSLIKAVILRQEHMLSVPQIIMLYYAKTFICDVERDEKAEQTGN